MTRSGRPSSATSRLELRRLTAHASELHFLDLPGRLASRLARMAEDVAPGQPR